VQVVADLVCLTSLVHFLGGVVNFCTGFYFFHVVITSIRLRRKNTYCLAVLADQEIPSAPADAG